MKKAFGTFLVWVGLIALAYVVPILWVFYIILYGLTLALESEGE